MTGSTGQAEQDALPGRATNIEEYGAMMGRAMLGERTNHRPYEPQQGDVFITSWAKSGTTMSQQMFHQLRTGAAGGDMDFDDISRVVPWDDTAYLIDFDMTAPQVASPRGFKSHREYERLPAAMRYVVTLRDPKETFVSFYRFLNGWHLEPGAVQMEDFMPFWEGGGPGGCDYATHLISWYARLNEPDSLVTTYRWTVKNRAQAIRQMAKLCDIELTPQIEALVLERTTREFMSEHEHRFDDAMICAVLEERCGVAAASDSTKVQKSGSTLDALPASISDAIDAMWAERIAPVTGHADFASLAKEVDAAQGGR
ncbi:sulfotransferase [Erythrobacter sp. KY5]|uniref:sulfotransferase domain-containing protein n=1 Tax=Erythrobacter sp. KY5 TaxID=2011159 RepID=UPI000DBF335A|nr:sulfotransferase domain-containing protein [Erythrobacter sp. KY5]AWW73504.1 sulfotransferase [Erythrobacter sp. KY5]